MNMDKLQELQQRLDLIQCDGSADSMLELVNIMKDLIQEQEMRVMGDGNKNTDEGNSKLLR